MMYKLILPQGKYHIADTRMEFVQPDSEADKDFLKTHGFSETLELAKQSVVNEIIQHKYNTINESNSKLAKYDKLIQQIKEIK